MMKKKNAQNYLDMNVNEDRPKPFEDLFKKYGIVSQLEAEKLKESNRKKQSAEKKNKQSSNLEVDMFSDEPNIQNV